MVTNCRCSGAANARQEQSNSTSNTSLEHIPPPHPPTFFRSSEERARGGLCVGVLTPVRTLRLESRLRIDRMSLNSEWFATTDLGTRLRLEPCDDDAVAGKNVPPAFLVKKSETRGAYSRPFRRFLLLFLLGLLRQGTSTRESPSRSRGVSCGSTCYRGS